jgi:sugar/nucleoside kinase (ribokinase family)
MPGGVVHYAGVALQGLGLDTAIITKAARDDAGEVLRMLREAGVTTYCRESPATTVFENIYSGGDLAVRSQAVRSIAAAFEPRDLGPVRARLVHLGPLTREEMPAEFLAAVSKRAERVSLDVQGFVRRLERQQVRLADWPDKKQGLAGVDVLKASLPEAQILSGEDDPERAARSLADLGPSEVIVTLGAKGSLILAAGRCWRIPAFAPRAVVDRTGCGDTYCAGYIFHRLRSDDIAAAGRFAAALATLKLERRGPYAGDAKDVGAVLTRVRRCARPSA